MSGARGRRLRWLTFIRGAWGVVLVSCPGPVIESVPGAEVTSADRRVARVLGVRQLIQATAGAASGTARRVWWVDALHSASMVAISVVAPAYRRLAGTDALIAAGFAAATLSADSGRSGQVP